MERLTFDGNFCDICMCQGQYRMTSECADGDCSQKKVWERLKEYEDAEAEGRLFIAPVAVGQTVWLILNDYPARNRWFISQEKVTLISTKGFSLWDSGVDGYISYNEIGDGNYYLTEAEAQEELRKLVEHGTV